MTAQDASVDGGEPDDGGAADAGGSDAGGSDAGGSDGGVRDAGLDGAVERCTGTLPRAIAPGRETTGFDLLPVGDGLLVVFVSRTTGNSDRRVVMLDAEGAPMGPATTLDDGSADVFLAAGSDGPLVSMATTFDSEGVRLLSLDNTGAVVRDTGLTTEASREPSVGSVGDVSIVAWVRDGFSVGGDDAVRWAVVGPSGITHPEATVDLGLTSVSRAELVVDAGRVHLVYAGRVGGPRRFGWVELHVDGTQGTPVFVDDPPSASFDAVSLVADQLAFGWTAVTSFSPVELDAGFTLFNATTGARIAQREFTTGVDHRAAVLVHTPTDFAAALVADDSLSWLSLSRDLETADEVVVPSTVAAFSPAVDRPVRLLDGGGRAVAHIDAEGELYLTQIDCE